MNNKTEPCDSIAGACKTSQSNPEPQELSQPQPHSQKPVQLFYFTDPICSACWGIEAQLRKLSLQYGDFFSIDYYMGGLLPNWEALAGGGISKPADVAVHWQEASEHYQMPIVGDVWLEDPLSSSFPPSIAFKAAQLQDEQKALVFLRRLRELLFVQKKNITRWQYVEQAAQQSGLEIEQFKNHFEGHAHKLFEQDLLLARQMGVRGFPTVFFATEHAPKTLVYGAKPYAVFEDTLLSLLADSDIITSPIAVDSSLENLSNYFFSLTQTEFSVLADIDFDEAGKQLNAFAQKNNLPIQKSKNGNIWR